MQSELRVNVKSVRRVRQFLQQAGYVVEEKISGPCDTTESSKWSPPKKRKRQTESSGGNTTCTVKIRLLKPFVLKTDCIQQPDDTNEDEEENSVDDDDDEGDDNREDGEDAAWSEGKHCMWKVIAVKSNILPVWLYCITMQMVDWIIQ